MSIISLEERFSDSPYVERIWRSQTGEAGTFTSIATSHSSMVIWEEAGEIHISVCGPETVATTAPVPEDSPSFGVIFKLGVSLPHFPPSRLIDRQITLPRAGSRSFWLKGSAWQFPTYENLDTFIARLVRDDLLGHEPLVAATLIGTVPEISTRTLQRRFLRATGITPTVIHQIERARYATLLLKRGMPILDVIAETGYYDQPHMTRLLKRYIGQTPARIADETHREEMSFLYKTSLLW